jgi:hypothetical protein
MVPPCVVTHDETSAIIDLGFFSRFGQDDPYAWRQVIAAQFANESLDCLVAGAIAVLAHQVLPGARRGVRERHGNIQHDGGDVYDAELSRAGASQGRGAR